MAQLGGVKTWTEGTAKDCWLSSPQTTPYISGGRIQGRINYNLSGCTLSFRRTAGFAEVSGGVPYFYYNVQEVNGVAPNSAYMSFSMPCKPGNWATYLSFDFGAKGYWYAQSSVISIARC